MGRPPNLPTGSRVRWVAEPLSYGTYLGRHTLPDGRVCHAVRLDDGRSIYTTRKELKPL